MLNEHIKVLNDVGASKMMRLLLVHTDSLVAGMDQAYDERYKTMLGNMNSISLRMNELQDNVNTQMDSMSTALQSIVDTMDTISAKMDTLSEGFNDLSDKVNTVSDTVDSIDKGDSSVQESINSLAADMSDIKDAMGNMIVNIENDPETGNFVVYHYDGTVVRSQVVDSISDSDIDAITSGELTEEDIHREEGITDEESSEVDD